MNDNRSECRLCGVIQEVSTVSDVNFEIILRGLLSPSFHLPRQILFPLLAQEFGRAQA